MSHPAVILYRYHGSPFAQKIDHVLTMKNISHHRVKINFILPRPELSEMLGIPYRRVPVLAIGNDVYCDTSLISSALERRFPSSAGYGTIFPPRTGGGKIDMGNIQLFTQSYVDKTLFPLTFGFFKWEKFPPSFIADRSDVSVYWIGSTIDTEAWMKQRPQKASLLSSHLAMVESQLADERVWLFDTDQPSLADISLYAIYTLFPKERAFIHEIHPYTLKWMTRMATLLKAKNTPPIFKDITGEEAANLILSSPFESYDVVGFDPVEANRLNVKRDTLVAIAPDDTGRGFPTTGKLVGLNHEEFVIEIVTQDGSSVVRCHFPRLGFTIESVPDSRGKL